MSSLNPYTQQARNSLGNSTPQNQRSSTFASAQQSNNLQNNINNSNQQYIPNLNLSQGSRVNRPAASTVSHSERVDRMMAFGLFIAAVVITIFFYVVTDNTTKDNCDSLYRSSEVNEYLWYYTAIFQVVYLVLSYGAHKWACVYFLEDLPKIYRSINFMVLAGILGSAIWLQVTLNETEKCGALQTLAKNYLIVTYILIAICFSYLIYNFQKQSPPSYSVNNNQQINQSTFTERSSLPQNPRLQSYNTFVEN